MPDATIDKVPHAVLLQSMTDETFLQAWHDAVSHGDEEQLTSFEGNATHRFGMHGWQERYAAEYPAQTRYRIPPKQHL